jgi:hypothetical protein
MKGMLAALCTAVCFPIATFLVWSWMSRTDDNGTSWFVASFLVGAVGLVALRLRRSVRPIAVGMLVGLAAGTVFVLGTAFLNAVVPYS